MTKTTKRIASIFAAIAIMLSVICVAGATTAEAATDKVSLYVDTKTWSWHGAATHEVLIQTRGNASEEAVYVHNYVDIIAVPYWTDTEATYVTTLADGSKIWKASFTCNNCQYAIKYEADGVTYWDNNNGNDYDGTATLGSADIAVPRQYNLYGYNFNAVLKNYGYQKNVFARYTTDNWNTYHDVPLYYVSGENGIENWKAPMPYSEITNEDDFEYAICYQVNGNEYWANNCGENYDLTYITAR